MHWDSDWHRCRGRFVQLHERSVVVPVVLAVSIKASEAVHNLHQQYVLHGGVVASNPQHWPAYYGRRLLHLCADRVLPRLRLGMLHIYGMQHAYWALQICIFMARSMHAGHCQYAYT